VEDVLCAVIPQLRDRMDALKMRPMDHAA